jgi:hypothetical protein
MRRLLLGLLLTTVVGCEIDSYEKGEGRYSLTQADLCELHVDARQQGVSIVTDEGASYQLTSPVTAQWIATPDTTYRVLMYYNKVDETHAKTVSLGTVVTLQPVAHWRFKEQPQDPLGLESAWLATTRRYLNMGLLVKTGRINDEELPHNIGLAQDTVYRHEDGRSAAYYRLLHSQNGIPEYYTNRRYVSILLPTPLPDTVVLTMETYEGRLQRRFIP